MPQSFRRCWLTEVSSDQLLTEGESYPKCGEQKLFLGKRLKSQTSAKTYITSHDLMRHHNQPTRTPTGSRPPKPGDQPPWVPLIEGSIALMFNTCMRFGRRSNPIH
ncbi:UDPGT domain-containing protein [Abeliophyllum distichum]|uniref:UDPGT domain-containing protein n=1 Tax=Abeliophyllum distichum TaxID=126358 RepID=A0ABD1VZ11_9LAMI